MQLDNQFLQDVGLGGMPDDQKQAFLQHLYEELELRVGTRLSEGMSNEQLEEFEKLIDANNQQGALTWLETNRPNYKQVVAEELEKLKQEVTANKDMILSGMQQPAQDNGQGVAMEQLPGAPQSQQPPMQQPNNQSFGQPPQAQDSPEDPTQLNIR